MLGHLCTFTAIMLFILLFFVLHLHCATRDDAVKYQLLSVVTMLYFVLKRNIAEN